MIPIKNRQAADDPHLRIAARTEPRVLEGVHTALQVLKRGFEPARVVAAVNHDRVPILINQNLDIFKANLARVFENVRTAYDTAANGAVIRKDARSDAVFAQYVADQIRQITDEQRAKITSVIQLGFSKGQSIDKVARTLRDGLGLTDSQTQAVANYRNMLETKNPQALNSRLRDARYDSAVAGPKPLSSEQIDQMVDRYTDRYVALRAKTIARYETLRASNAGGFAAIQDLLASSNITPDQVTKTWMISDDEKTCPTCRSVLDIQPDGVGLDQPFQWRHETNHNSYAGAVDLPPLHPNCRCTVTYEVTQEGSSDESDQEGG